MLLFESIPQESDFLRISIVVIGCFQYERQFPEFWMIRHSRQSLKPNAALSDTGMPVFMGAERIQTVIYIFCCGAVSV